MTRYTCNALKRIQNLIWISSYLIRHENQSPIMSTPKPFRLFHLQIQHHRTEQRRGEERTNKKRIKRFPACIRREIRYLSIFIQIALFFQSIYWKISIACFDFCLIHCLGAICFARFFFLFISCLRLDFLPLNLSDSNEEILHSLINHYRIVTSLMTCICCIELSNYFLLYRKRMRPLLRSN